MSGHPALQRALVKWSGANPKAYDAVVWQLAAAAERVLRPTGNMAPGEHQAMFGALDRILRGAPAAEKKPT
jgi:hypothetical protein